MKCETKSERSLDRDQKETNPWEDYIVMGIWFLKINKNNSNKKKSQIQKCCERGSSSTQYS